MLYIAIVPDLQCDTITSAPTRKKVLNEKEPSKYVGNEIIVRTSAMITVWCASVTRARAESHELDADVRSQAST